MDDWTESSWEDLPTANTGESTDVEDWWTDTAPDAGSGWDLLDEASQTDDSDYWGTLPEMNTGTDNDILNPESPLYDQSTVDLVKQYGNNPTVMDFVKNSFKSLGDKAGTFIKQTLFNKDGSINLAGLATGAVALKALTGGDKPKSNAYQGEIPKLAAVNQQIAYDDPNRRPGSMGRQYFIGNKYVTPDQEAAAQAAAQKVSEGIASGYKPATAEVNPYAGKFAMPYAAPATGNVTTSVPPSGVASVLPVPTANETLKKLGGLAGGGMAHGRYLQGTTDGMADKIPSSIDGKQEAALSHGEFVIPADVVSHLGNGNSDAGAKKLYEMMSRVRKARTGNPEQGKKIDPNKFVPGGQVGFAAGGIAHFVGGGEAAAPSTGVTTPAIPSQGTSKAEGLSTWAGPYVSTMLGKGEALSNQPYQTYTGPLTAGASDLQNQQYAGLSDVAQTGYSPTQFKGGIFDTTAAQQYMNPYLSSALDPQLAELRRQGQITNLGNQAQATKMGAFGGSGSTLMQTEGQRNVLDKMQETLGQGYNTAYDRAMAQYNADQTRAMQAQQDTEASRQFGANFGLKTLADLGTAGATQRDIEQQGISADKAQFEEKRDYPYKQVQFQKSLLTGLPITTSDTTDMQSQIGTISNQISGLASLYKTLSGLGQA
jgi:hypothetical protein